MCYDLALMRTVPDYIEHFYDRVYALAWHNMVLCYGTVQQTNNTRGNTY
jgi:hypothetical protein